MAAAATYEKVSIVHIPDDVSFSILSKLPLKSLKRFTCVKKSWSLLLQNPHFMNMFRTNLLVSKHDEDDDNMCLLLKEMKGHENHDSLCTLSGKSFENRVRLDWPPPLRGVDSFIRIWCTASVNGILCLSQGFLDPITIVLWNPASGEYKVVPRSRGPYPNVEYNTYPFSFGYDRVRDDYKVIRAVDPYIYFEDTWVYLPEKNSPLWEMDVDLDDDDDFWEEVPLDMYDPYWEIYSLKNNSWRKLDGIDRHAAWNDRCEVNLNEWCHWLGLNNDMVSFDFSNELFFVTTLPSFDFSKETSYEGISSFLDFKRRHLERNLVVLNGSIAFICTVLMTAYFHIWVLGELGVTESWTKLFVVGPLPSFMRPIAVGLKSDIFYIKEDKEIACFDLSTQRIVEVGIKEDRAWLQIIIYKENLRTFRGINN
jgi:molecular chaperone HtpG